MPLVTVPQSNPNDEITALAVNQGPNAVAAVVNGNLDDTNIASLSGTKIASGTIPVSALATPANPETRFSEVGFDFVASGLVWSGDSYGSTRAASMTAGVVYISGKRLTVSAVTARSFTASKDTYVDVDSTGTVTYTEVTNNAASPALAAGSIRIAIIVTGASSIAAVGSVNQGQENKVLPIASSIPCAVTDSLGNLICARDPLHTVIGYRQLVADTSVTATSSTLVPGLTCTVIIPNNRKIKVSFQAGKVSNNTNDRGVFADIWEGTVGSGTRLAQSYLFSGVLNRPYTLDCDRQYTPTSTTLTFNVGAAVDNSGTGTMFGTISPIYLKVELV